MLQHKHLLVRAEIKNPPKNEEFIKSWFLNLIKTINMKVLMGPIAAYVEIPGNQGLTCVAVIETSHIAMHVWDETDPALMQLDVYTCGALDIDDVFNSLEVFDPVHMDYKYLDREQGFHTLSRGLKKI